MSTPNRPGKFPCCDHCQTGTDDVKLQCWGEGHDEPCLYCQVPAVASDRACGTCGEREGSTYAKRCCTSDNMVEL